MILFFAGIGLIVQEAQRNGAERPTLLLLYAAMIGLPAFLQRDDRNGRNGK